MPRVLLRDRAIERAIQAAFPHWRDMSRLSVQRRIDYVLSAQHLWKDERGFFQFAAGIRGGDPGVVLSSGQNLSTGPVTFTSTTTFTVTRTAPVIAKAQGGGGGGNHRQSGAGHDDYGGGGGGQGAWDSGTLVTLLTNVTYQAEVGPNGVQGEQGSATAGGTSRFRINAGTIFIEVGGGQPGGAFTGSIYPGGLGGTHVTGSTPTNGGQGGNGGNGGLAATDHGGAGQATGAGGGGGNGFIGPAGNGGASGGGSPGGTGGAANGVGGNGGITGGPFSAVIGYGGGGGGANSFVSSPGGPGTVILELV